MTIKVDDNKNLWQYCNKSGQISEDGEHNSFAWVDQEQLF